jgi:hypothetical protein
VIARDDFTRPHDSASVVCTSVNCEHPKRYFNCGHSIGNPRTGVHYVRHHGCVHSVGDERGRCVPCCVAKPLRETP